ncbi:MAG: AMP-binding protein [Muribaculaceae bacterium]|nr:AMP-binding protein [Muribaculaceae bacterium]
MEGIELRRLWWALAMQWGCGASCIQAHTSGSTGKPKEILLPREAVRLSAMRTNAYFGINADSRLHSCVSPEFIGGKMMMIRALEAGCAMTYEPPSNRPILSPCGVIDLLAVVPSMMHHILLRRREGTLPDIRAILVGGSAIPAGLRRDIAASGLDAYETYGMTETCSHIALRRIEADEKPFTPLPGISVAADARGCLVIEVPGIDRPVLTNDIAEFSDGGFRILGRADSVIVTGGRKVYPEDVERRMADLIPGTFVVAGHKSELWGEEITLWIDADCAPEEFTPADSLAALVRSRLAPWETPKRYYRGRIPLTPSGKVVRRSLPFPD